MHSRNRYKDRKPDFVQLARAHPPLEKQLIKKGDDYATLDFRDPKSQRELTVALLKHDFNLSVDIPLDKLIPTVPQKLNYIHWIEDLLAGCNNGCIPRGPEVVGIDVGTGASCVYPLLGHTINGWVFMATEIEPLSVDFARENVEKNGLQQSIEVCHVDQSTFLVGALKEGKKYNFSMCNPPFYPEDHDLHGSCSHGDRPPACSINTGQPHETATVGGEEVFVQKLIDDSLCLRDQVRWYTTMLGKKSSVKKIKAYLKDKKVPMVTSTEFIQGKTRRWGLAWSFVQSVKVPGKTQSSAQRSCYKAVLKKSSAEMGCPKGTSPLTKYASVRFEALLDRLEVEHCDVDEATGVWVCKTKLATWANQRRKRRILQSSLSDTAAKKKHLSTDSGANESASNENTREVLPAEFSSDGVNVDESELAARLRDLSPPYVMTFRAMIYADVCPQNVVLEVELLDGENGDHLHQLLQYIRNHW